MGLKYSNCRLPVECSPLHVAINHAVAEVKWRSNVARISPPVSITAVVFNFQRTKNTWVTLVVHLLYNGLTPILLLLIVLGVVG